MVEAHGEVTGQLHVLALVVADGHLVGVVQQDVGGHQRRVGEQPGGDELGPVALVLELGHAPQLADRCGALEDPRQLGVLGHVALHEQRRAVRVDADGQQQLGQLEGAGPQLQPGSWGTVRACRSTTQKMVSASSWSATQWRSAPRRLPSWTGPVGLMPEKTRVMAGDLEGDPRRAGNRFPPREPPSSRCRRRRCRPAPSTPHGVVQLVHDVAAGRRQVAVDRGVEGQDSRAADRGARHRGGRARRRGGTASGRRWRWPTRPVSSAEMLAATAAANTSGVTQASMTSARAWRSLGAASARAPGASNDRASSSSSSWAAEAGLGVGRQPEESDDDGRRRLIGRRARGRGVAASRR